MSDSHSSDLVAAVVAIAGSISGDYSAIVFGALAGSLWPLAREKTATRAEGAFLMFRLITMASVLAGAVAYLIDAQFHIPVAKGMGIAGFGIAVLGNRWQSIFDAIGNRIEALIGSMGGHQ